jgi:Flp pilus assembly protein TadG
MAGLARRFAGDSRGVTATMFGLMFGVLLMSVGVAVDTARLYSLSDKVRNALDSAALAGARLLDVENSTDGQVTERARAFFETYRAQMQLSDATFGSPSVVTNRTDGTVTVSVDVDYRTLFGQLMSVTNIKFTPSATVQFKSKKIELAMVLDITGSMCEPLSSPCASAVKLDALKAAARDLIDVLQANNPDPGAVRISIVPYASSVNIGSYFTTATNTAAGADTCVVERGTMPGAVVDDPPGPGRWVKVNNGNPNYACPSAEFQPLLDISLAANKTTLVTLINSLIAQGYTAGHVGAAWGWYTISPLWSSVWPSDNRPKPAGPDVLKAVLLMTDGEFNTAYWTPNGGSNTSDFTVNHSSGDQTLGLCQNMRDAGIVVLTVAFEAPALAETLLQNCAGAGNAFSASNAAQLNAKFREIGERLSMLRLSK